MPVFHPDSKAMIVLSNILDYVKLGLLVLLCSIPVFTLGTAIAAGMSVAMKIERGEAPAICKPFQKAFCQNMKQGIPLTVFFELVISLLAFDWYQIMEMKQSTITRLVTVMLVVLVLLIVMIGFYVFAGMARYELKWKALIKNAVIYTFLNFPKNLLAIGILLVGILFYSYIRISVPIVICFVPAIELFYMGKVCVKTFQRLEKQEGEENGNNNV